ncbi:hypothetical protein NYR79_05740 [Actinobacillus equuli subsp. haemolyticus]|uniref:hypothetical protein n=1 Tax=Actinobacillus equuli TaxID=718 RepID=UPI0024412AFE|nr:hypothetical protein [Actinobacillus equuli]WGE70367.1 hypothetical protein NYR79_05740 [Actinobacillus equuli subsp. haemolyticus]
MRDFDFINVDGMHIPLAKEGFDYKNFSLFNKDYMSSSFFNLDKDTHNDKSYDFKPKLEMNKIQDSYIGMPKQNGFHVILHEYKDTTVGHVNIEFLINGTRYSWLGANREGFNKSEPGLSGGIFDETKHSRKRISNHHNSHQMTIFNVTESEFNKMFNRANELERTLKDYDLTKNCVDFAHDILSHGLNRYGSSGESLKDYLYGNTVANFYAEIKSLGVNFNSPNFREEHYREIINANRQHLIDNKFHGFLDLKLEETKKILHTESIPNSVKAKLNVHSNGNVYASSGKKNDVYNINIKDLHEENVIYDEGGQDKLILKGSKINSLWFQKNEEDLHITELSSRTNPLIIRGWFKQKFRGGMKRRFQADTSFQIEEIQLDNGHNIIASTVNRLVDAMATFGSPEVGQLTLTSVQQNTVNTIITANLT